MPESAFNPKPAAWPYRLRSLRSKLPLLFLALLVLATAVHVWVFYRISRDLNSLTVERLSRDLAAAVVSKLQPLLDRGAGQNEILRLGLDISEINPAVAIFALDANGNCAFGISPMDSECSPSLSPSDLEARLDVSQQHAPFLKSGYPFSAARLQFAGKSGYLVVLPNGSKKYQYARNVSREDALIIHGGILIVGAALLSFALSLGCLSLLSDRFERLISAVRRFQSGNFQERAAVEGDDELADLANTFNTMAERIAEQIKSLEERDVHRRELLSDISHDLRTRLTVLRMKAAEMEPKVDASETESRYRTSMETHTRMLEDLLYDLLELSRLEAGQLTCRKVPCDIEEVIDEICSRLTPRATEKNIILQSELQHDLPLVPLDASIILRVLKYLLENRITHSPKGGIVRLSASRTAAGIRVAISDSGRIGPEAVPRVFEGYYRNRAVHPSLEDSTGLGLIIVKMLLELHGSGINVVSAPEAGTEFSFILHAA